MVQQAIEHGTDGSDIAEQFAPVFYRRFEVSNVLNRS
jgi:hypothetical protein